MPLMIKEIHIDPFGIVPMSFVPPFETPRLFLRGISARDVPAYEKHFIDFEVVKYLSNQVPWPYPPKGVESFFKNHLLPDQGISRWTWGLFLKDNPDELIGIVELFRPGIPENRGFWLGRKFWKQGLMTEALKPITNFAFNILGFDTLRFSNAVSNVASRKLKEKYGATLVGTRAARFVSPKENQAEVWELTKEKWFQVTRPPFIGHYLQLQDEDSAHYPNSSELLSIGSPIGQKLGLKKIGIHVETLPPARRTSWPHAEKDTEEFVFVVKGRPDAWINGVLYPLFEGDFVAFPAGTGIAHTLINNSNEEVLLLVGGETSLGNNRLIYPLDPERNAQLQTTQRLWTDAPKQEMGAHDGLPDKLRKGTA